MALAVFDADKHHIALSEVGASQDGVGFITSGSYSRGFRREKESQFDGIRYGGGDSLVNKPGVSSWTQDDFTGGIFQYVWGKDEAQFARSKNALPSQFDRSIRSVPPLQQWLGGKRFATSQAPLLVHTYNGFLVAVFDATIRRWDLSTGAASSVNIGGTGSDAAACFLRDRGHILHADDDQVGLFDLDSFIAAYTYSFGPPSGSTGNVTGMSGNGDKVAIAYGDVLWSVRLPDNRSTPPSDLSDPSDFTRMGRLPGRWVDSGWASGLLYILLAGEDTATQLVAWDGTQILPITDFPYNFVGDSLAVYGGRIYVGGSGADVQTGVGRYAELYEVTGASLRLLKTFAPERLGAGDVYGTTIHSLTVHEGLLFFGVKGLGLMAYDLTTDSFYGASVFAPDDTNADFINLVSGRHNLFSWVYPIAGSPGESGWFRPATSQETVISYDTEVETSDFAMAFDRTKRWRELKVLTRFANSGIGVDYSTDGGGNWTALSNPDQEFNGRFQLSTYDLSDVAESRMIRFRIKLVNGTDVSSIRELVAFTASFRMLESDAVGSGEQEKLAWTFVVCGSDLIEATDGSTLQQDVDEIHDLLWYWARGRKRLHFRDLDGSIFTVEIDTLEETQPVVLPPIEPTEANELLTGDSVREAFYRVTLVEV